MVKFKKGDRCKIIGFHGNCYSTALEMYKVGDTVVVDQNDSSCPWILDEQGERRTFVGEKSLELLTPQNTPISPKVGEKYRVIKDFWGDYKEGDEVVIKKIRDDGTGIIEIENGFCIRGVIDFCTTEYLELVSEPVQEQFYVKGVIEMMEEVSNYESGSAPKSWGVYELVTKLPKDQPINQSIIKKTMNLIKKALLSKDDKNLIKAGYMDDNMNLTSRGREALEFITFTENKAKLVEMAEAQIAEDKEDKE